MNNSMIIAVTEAKHAAERHDTLDARLRAAMGATRDHWLVRGPEDRFLAAVAGVYELSDEPTRGRIKAELDVLRGLAAASSGIPVAFEGMVMSDKPIGLAKLWREVSGMEDRP